MGPTKTSTREPIREVLDSFAEGEILLGLGGTFAPNGWLRHEPIEVESALPVASGTRRGNRSYTRSRPTWCRRITRKAC